MKVDAREAMVMAAPRQSGRWRVAQLVALIVASIVFIYAHFLPAFEGYAISRSQSQEKLTFKGKKPWSWSDITPSREIEWHSCFEDFDCARLDVPLDWLEPSDEARVVLAVIRLRATELADYRGLVFFNPGGPGASGVFAMRDRGKYIQKIVGENHDLISFDPRGIVESTPEIQCWPSDQSARIWSLLGVGAVDAHPGILYDAYARASAFSAACASAMGGTLGSNGSQHGVLSYISTTSVARDMLEILTKLGEKKLKYWGFSYGTMLGGMFAALWPEKVERMVNDGNVNYGEWTTNTHASFSNDADKVMNAFYKYCHLAGPDGCAFYSSTPEAIEERLAGLLENLKVRPVVVPVPLRIAGLPEIIYYSSVRQLIASSLYSPVHVFPALANILASLEAGDGTPFVDLYGASQTPLSCDPGNSSSPIEDKMATADAFPAVLCTDGGEMDDSIEAVEGYTKDLLKASKAAGAVNAMTRMSCVGWRIRAKWRYSGMSCSAILTKRISKCCIGAFAGKTSYPILFIGNKADNVTPVKNSIQNAEGFENATVLILDSAGVSDDALITWL